MQMATPFEMDLRVITGAIQAAGNYVLRLRHADQPLPMSRDDLIARYVLFALGEFRARMEQGGRGADAVVDEVTAYLLDSGNHQAIITSEAALSGSRQAVSQNSL